MPPILGNRIVAAHLFWERTLATPEPDAFYPRIIGQKIREIGRRGKFLLMRLSKDWLIFHLRMSGDLLVEPLAAPMAPHHRLVLDLDDELRLAFNDTRKFGRAWLVYDPQSVLQGLGPEPLSPEFTPTDLYQRLHERRRQLKPLLLDQTFLAGMGNIYTDEALHRARLHPLTLSENVTPEEAERLWRAIREVLQRGIRLQGASIDWAYRGGGFQETFSAYHQAGNPCPVCGTPIEKIVVGQRSTHFCPVCQPPPITSEGE